MLILVLWKLFRLESFRIFKKRTYAYSSTNFSFPVLLLRWASASQDWYMLIVHRFSPVLTHSHTSSTDPCVQSFFVRWHECRPCPGPGAGRSKRQQQLAQHCAVIAGHRVRDSGHPDGDLLARLRGRDALLERAAYEAGRVPPGWPHPTTDASRLDLAHSLHISDRRRGPGLPRHKQRHRLAPRHKPHAGESRAFVTHARPCTYSAHSYVKLFVTFSYSCLRGSCNFSVTWSTYAHRRSHFAFL